MHTCIKSDGIAVSIHVTQMEWKLLELDREDGNFFGKNTFEKLVFLLW